MDIFNVISLIIEIGLKGSPSNH